MKTQNVMTIITIVAAVSTPILLNYLTEGEVFRNYPQYEITAKLHSSDVGDFSRLTITNTGSVQAKDVKVHVISDNKIEVKKIRCFDVTSYKYGDDGIFRIDFSTLSNHIPCKIDFVGKMQIPEIAITSIDSPGKYFSNHNKIEFNKDYEEVLKEDSSELSSEIIIPALLALYLAILIPLYAKLIYRFIVFKKQLQSKQKALEFILYKTKSELKIILDNVDKDKDIIKNKIRIMELHDEIRNTNHDLDMVKCKLILKSSQPIILKKIEDLFKNWKTIEYDLALMVKDIDIENTSQPLDKLVQELKNTNKVNDDFVNSFNVAYSGRSKIIHGNVEKSFWRGYTPFIKNQIKIIQNLQNMIDKINDPHTK